MHRLIGNPLYWAGLVVSTAVVLIVAFGTPAKASTFEPTQPNHSHPVPESLRPNASVSLPLAETVIQHSAYTVTGYVVAKGLILTQTHTLTGTFPDGAAFSFCPNAQDLAFTSDGGTCQADPARQSVDCPSGITRFAYSFACPYTLPALTAYFGMEALVEKRLYSHTHR